MKKRNSRMAVPPINDNNKLNLLYPPQIYWLSLIWIIWRRTHKRLILLLNLINLYLLLAQRDSVHLLQSMNCSMKSFRINLKPAII
jgi:hypothetical protein